MKKIGIVTHYYKSKNYGGNLQAYALCEFLNKNYIAEQICYNQECSKSDYKKYLKSPIVFVKKVCRKCWAKFKKVINRKNAKKIELLLEERNRKFTEFNKGICHSTIVYNEYSINQALKEYDLFITGSDQVWHPAAVNDAYLLNFVQGKPKISYAASLSVDSLTPQDEERMRQAIEDYTAISVREESAVSLLQPLAKQPVVWVLDPVFLLSKEEWSSFPCDINIEKKYLLCYFLGGDKKARRLAKEYAKKYDLQLVNIAYASGEYNQADRMFGDMKLTDVSPTDFVALIKNAELIFTDSFHAMAYSLIFEKNYFVFTRKNGFKMGSRIYSLSKLYQTENRFCNTKERMSLIYLENVESIDYHKPNELFEAKKKETLMFLENCLRKAGE